jgi:hypothetical protein
MGVLYLTTAHIHWCVHGSNEPTVILPFNEIKSILFVKKEKRIPQLIKYDNKRKNK